MKERILRGRDQRKLLCCENQQHCLLSKLVAEDDTVLIS